MSLKNAIVGPPLAVRFGGQEVQAGALFARWQEDPEVAALFISSRPVLPKVLSAINRVPYVRTIARLPFYGGNLFRAISRADLVHIFAGSFGTFLVATLPAFIAAQMQGKRVLIHYHSGRGGEHLKRSRLAREVLRRCDAVVVPSEYLAASFRMHGISPVAIPNLVDPDMYSYRVRNPLKPRLLCTRNLEAHYGVDVVIRAFANVQREFPEASLCLAGSGEQAEELKQLVGRLGLNHVEFAGAVHPDAMPGIYSQSDIFVNGSYIDCAPVSILEAFCSGLPVVTTASGGIPYLVEHGRTGLLCATGDWQALAHAVIDLLRNPDLASAVTEKARQQAQIHSWQGLREHWLTAYRTACVSVQ